MTAIEIVRYETREGLGTEFIMQLRTAITAMRRHPACIDVVAYRGVEEPDTFQLFVTWTSVEDHRAWRDSPERAEYRSQIMDWLRQLPVFGHFTPIELPADDSLRAPRPQRRDKGL